MKSIISLSILLCVAVIFFLYGLNALYPKLFISKKTERICAFSKEIVDDFDPSRYRSIGKFAESDPEAYTRFKESANKFLYVEGKVFIVKLGSNTPQSYWNEQIYKLEVESGDANWDCPAFRKITGVDVDPTVYRTFSPSPKRTRKVVKRVLRTYRKGEQQRRLNIPENLDLIVEGGLDTEVVAKYIKRYMNQMRDCYEQTLQSDPDVLGWGTVQFEIELNGSVKETKMLNSTLDNSTLHSCIQQKIKSWRFPRASGTVLVKYPFSLVPN